MSRDYAKKPKTKTHASRGSRKNTAPPRKKTYSPSATTKQVPWPWLLAGLLLGLFMASLIYLKFISQGSHQQRSKTFANVNSGNHFKKNHHAKNPKAKEKIITEPRFDFYRILPKAKVWTPHQPNTKVQVPQQPPKPTAYNVQVASFKTFQQANNLKARLLLQGLSPNITAFVIHCKTWYRVWLGPFPSTTKAHQVQGKLMKRFPHTLMVKVAE